MDSIHSHPSDQEGPESATQKQARLRRERREAKIKAGGSSRLDKITQLSGRPVEPALNEASPSPQTAPPSQNYASTPDPEEIDISNHPYTPRSRSNDPGGRQSGDVPTEADIRALFRSGGPPPGVETGLEHSQQKPEDPMMRLLQQMIGGVGSEPYPENSDGLPPGLAAMLDDMGAGVAGIPEMDGLGQQKPASSALGRGHTYLWKILHAIYATVLGIYLVSHPSFASSSARLAAVPSATDPPASAASGVREPEQPAVNMFWIFATAELILQGSRFFLEQRKDRSQGGWLQFMEGILPEPWKGRARLIGQYSGIWNTLVDDAMVVIFMMGTVGWWRD